MVQEEAVVAELEEAELQVVLVLQDREMLEVLVYLLVMMRLEAEEAQEQVEVTLAQLLLVTAVLELLLQLLVQR